MDVLTCRALVISAVLFYFIFSYFSNQDSICPASDLLWKKAPISDSTKISNNVSPTKIEHLLFGLVGSERAWHHRKAYIESWWRPNVTRGFVFLDRAPGPTPPWSPSSPPYRVSDDLTAMLKKSDVTAQRIMHAIKEVVREENREFRWLVMGDDDSIFFVDNMVEILGRYDHTKYYYFGGHSEFVLSNYWYSFSQAFGGAGFILSYPLAKLVAADMENCLIRYAYLEAADQTAMSCIADFGVSLTPLKGIHQIDLRGDISGFLSSHPQFPLMSLHHFDMVEPIFPNMDRGESARHLMKAAAADHSRMLQQTICHHRPTNWTFSISWGYSAHIYESIMPRSYLQYPIETFQTWGRSPRPPHYMFNTRLPSLDPCEAPHIFFFRTTHSAPRNFILTKYSRASARPMPACSISGYHSADSISTIQVYSPATKRFKIDRSECCDIVRVEGKVADLKFRECATGEIIA